LAKFFSAQKDSSLTLNLKEGKFNITFVKEPITIIKLVIHLAKYGC